MTCCWKVIGLLALVAAASCRPYSEVRRTPTARLAASEAQRELVRSTRPFSSQATGRLGLTLDFAREAAVRVGEDPDDLAALADYNFAVARVVEVVGEEDLEPWQAPVGSPSAVGEGSWRLATTRGSPCPQFSFSDFELRPADCYQFRGQLVKSRTVRDGVGAPVVAVGQGADFLAVDRFAQGEVIYYGVTAMLYFEGATCRLEFYDPLEVESVQFAGRAMPLAADFKAPLALKLAELNPRRQQVSRMFRPQRYNGAARLARLQPYSPERIPVLFIHGLGNSPAIWMPVISHLRGDPTIRQHYQFWFFSHPTGIPYPISAASLRRQLDEIAEQYPDRKEIVVIGHSMGGMIARLLITDSGMKLWNAYFETPPEETSFGDETRAIVVDSLIFASREDVSRVIFVSASHRGSDHAAAMPGRIGARLIGNPIADDIITREAMTYLRADTDVKSRGRLPNSVEVLDPDSRWLQVVNTLPLDRSIPYHSLIGDRGRGGNLDRTRPQSSDGVVPYWSSHLEEAGSELVIPSGHWSHLHPEGKAEIKRILLEHLR